MCDVEDLHVMQAIQEGLKGSVDGVMEIAQRNLSSVSLFANTCLQMLQWRYTKIAPENINANSTALRYYYSASGSGYLLYIHDFSINSCMCSSAY